MDDRMELIDGIVDEVEHLCGAYAEVEEEETIRALYEEFQEWMSGEECEVLWMPNFANMV